MNDAIRILVADDEPDIRNVLNLLLTAHGYTVDEAENGLRAVDMVQTTEYDLIIMDIMMPGMSGTDACAQIRRVTKAPVLFLTAKDQDADQSAAFSSGGDDYLVKPFSKTTLFLHVEALLRRYRIYRGKGDSPTVIDSLEINCERGIVRKNGVQIEMTKTESELLKFLVAHRGEPVSARTLYENVWSEKFLPASTPSWYISSSCARSWRTIRQIRR